MVRIAFDVPSNDKTMLDLIQLAKELEKDCMDVFDLEHRLDDLPTNCATRLLKS